MDCNWTEGQLAWQEEEEEEEEEEEDKSNTEQDGFRSGDALFEYIFVVFSSKIMENYLKKFRQLLHAAM